MADSEQEAMELRLSRQDLRFARWCILTISKGFQAEHRGQIAACELLERFDKAWEESELTEDQHDEAHERENQTQATPPEQARHQAIDVGDRGEEERDGEVRGDIAYFRTPAAHAPAAKAPGAAKPEREQFLEGGALYVVKKLQTEAHLFACEIMHLGQPQPDGSYRVDELRAEAQRFAGEIIRLGRQLPGGILCTCGHREEDHEHAPWRPQCRFRTCGCGRFSVEAPVLEIGSL